MTTPPESVRRVAFVCDTDAGGAATAAHRIGAAIAAKGVATFWVYGEGHPDPGRFSAAQWPSLLRYGAFRLGSAFRLPEALGERARRRCVSSTVVQAVRRFSPDIISLHNVHKTMDESVVSALSAIAPVVWTLHDMWALTGYCCYSHACREFESGCGPDCPEWGNWGPATCSAAEGWQRRQHAFQHAADRLGLVAPSHWMLRCIGARAASARLSERIANGCDLGVFRPLGDRDAARKALGVPHDARKTVLLGGDSLADKRKGAGGALEALRRVAHETPIHVLTFGHDAGDIEPIEKATVQHLGFVRDERFLNMAYNAADVFVLATDADNLPNTLVESVAAGTPCVTHSVGGCGDVVQDGLTGALVPPGDTEGLANAVAAVLARSGPEADAQRARCRALAEQAFDAERQARAYLDFMQKLKALTASRK